ncbi:MAG: cytochrome c oxidase subunit 3 [Bacteroidota bacterium]
MKEKFKNAYSVETQEKTKKNLVWIIVFSIAMLFAGFTSAYIVSMGDTFWIKIDLPVAFYISTAVIILSSLTLFLAMRAARKKNKPQARTFVVLTLLLGVLFGVFQFQGYSSLVDRGAHWVTRIIVSEGRYGDYFEIKKQGSYLTVENNQYTYNGEQLKGDDLKELQDFARQFLDVDQDGVPQNLDYSEFKLYYKGAPLAYIDGELVRPNGKPLELLDLDRLRLLSRNIVDNRADFFMSGEMGKDFELLYNGKPLDYKERTLMYDGQPLSANLQNKLLRGNKDMSTAYFYIVTVLHLLHVVAGIIMLLVMTKRAFTGEIFDKNALSLRAGSIFWHFLGVLWIYLLLFLLFIH